MEELGKRLRGLRNGQELSLRQLAARVGCSASYLSMVENGKLDPSISRLKKIAEGLGHTIRELFQDHTGEEIIIRRNQRQKVEFPGSKLTIEILIPPLAEKRMDARLAIVAPGGGSEGDYQHPGEEFGLVVEGILELTVEGTTYRLEPGDSFYFASPRNHRFGNPGDVEAKIVWVNDPPSW